MRDHISSLFRRHRRFISVRAIVSINVFVLLVNTYVLIMQIQRSDYMPSESYFSSPMTAAQEEELRSILKLFVNTMESANVTYLMAFGTLLGSLRHHGMIPWDDDIDILVHRSHRERLIKALNQLEPKYELYQYMEWPSMGKWKFYKKSSSAFLLYPYSNFRWPYIDIFFYESHNSTHEKDSYYSDQYYSKKSLYPLRRRPYEGMMLPAPCNSWEVIREQFDKDFDPHACQSRSYSHLMEFPMPIWRQRYVDCSRLAHKFPFVYTSKLSDNSTKEILRVGTKVLRELVLQNAKCTPINKGLPPKTSIQDNVVTLR